MNMLIKNGTLVSGGGMQRADVLVKNGVIAAIGTGLEADAETLDAAGLLVLPGAIDAHTHLETASANTFSSDDYFAGTRSAACGGTTTVFDYILQEKGETMTDALLRRDALAKPKAAVDYSFHIGVSDVSSKRLLASVGEVTDMGVTSFKAYMVYDFGLNDGALYELLIAAKDAGALVAVHAENRGVINSRIKRFLEEGKTGAWWHYASRDELVECEADERAINIAKMAGAPLYIVHLANEGGMRAVTRARAEGYPVFAETCPQYLNFTSAVYRRERGRDFVCSPPIKGEASQKALWEGILRGDISTIATDHCPFKRSEKDWGVTLPGGKPGSFAIIPNGCAGIENMYPYMLSQANRGVISYPLAVRLCAEQPAKLFGIDYKKGFIKPGLDADIVLYNPNKRFTITNAAMHGDTDHTIWEGAELLGYPVATYSRGRLVYKDGDFTGVKGYGEFVPCKKVSFTSPLL